MKTRFQGLWLVLLIVLALIVLAMVATSCAQPAPQSAPAAPPATNAPAEKAPAPTTAPANPAATKVLYYPHYVKGHPVIRIMETGFLTGCKDLGYQCKSDAAEGGDIPAAVTLVEQAIAEGAGGIVMWASDPAFYPVMAKAKEKGIPVISPHFPIPQGTAAGLTAWVSTDPVKYGQESARAIGKAIGGKGTVAITQGSFNNTENAVSKAFTEVMKAEFPDVKVLEPQEEGFDPPTAIAKAVAIIQGNPDIKAALSTTGAGPTTWARAAEETGRKDGAIVIISMDYTRPNLDLVKAGKVYALVGQPLYEEHYQAVVMLDKILRGEKVPYENPLPAPLITKADLDKYYQLNDKVDQLLGAPAQAAAPKEEKPAAAGDWVKMTPKEMGCKHGKDGKCRVVLSNSFLGNDWRIQMQNTAKAAAMHEPFASAFDFEILNTEYSPEAQNAGLDNLLVQGVDVVLLDAYGPAAHTDWIERATKEGVVVVSFDIVTDSKLDYKVDWDFYTASKYAGLWFAKELDCKGKIAMDLGLQATAIAEQIAKGGRDAIKEVCGDGKIEEVATFYGEFAEGPMEPAVSSILATQPKLDGVYTQGYCTTVVSAYEAANRLKSDNPVVYCQGYNSNFILLAQGKARGVITAGSPAVSIMAMQTAYQVLTKQDVPKLQKYVLGVYATNTKHDIGVPYEQIELNKNAFPNLPGGFSSVMNITNSPPNPKIWVQITMDDLGKVGQKLK